MTEAAGIGWGDLLRVGAALALVVGLALVIGWVARRGLAGSRRRGLTLLERLPVGRGAQLALVSDGERRLLIGITEHGISLLRDAGPLEAAVPEGQDAAAPVPFAERLQAALRARSGS